MTHTMALPRVASYDPFNAVQQYGGDGEKTKPALGKPAVKVLASTAEPTVGEVALKWLKDASGVKNLILKPMYTLADWIFTFLPSATGIKHVAVVGKQAKNMMSGAEIPGKTVEAVQAVAEFGEKADISNFGKLANKVGLLTVPVIEFVRVISDIVQPMAAATARAVSTVFNSALVFTTGYDTAKQLKDIGTVEKEADEKLKKKGLDSERVIAARDAQVTQSWLAVGMNVSYFAIGVLGLASLFAGVVVAPWIILGLATSGLVFTVLKHFQKNIAVEPALARVHAAPAEGTV